MIDGHPLPCKAKTAQKRDTKKAYFRNKIENESFLKRGRTNNGKIGNLFYKKFHKYNTLILKYVINK